MRKKQHDKPVPNRLHLAVGRSSLAATLLGEHIEPAALFPSKRKARKRAAATLAGEKPAVVTLDSRDARREGIQFERAGGGWTPSGAIPAHLLRCRDAKALRALRAKRKRSAGGLVLSSVDDPRVMLMFRRDGEKTAWKTPKGGIAPGESLKSAALREVAEEAGLTNLGVEGYLGRMQYFKPHEKRGLQEKTVHIYLLVNRDGESGIEPREGEKFVSCEWLTFDEAIGRVTQPQARSLIAKANRRLSRKKK